MEKNTWWLLALRYLLYGTAFVLAILDGLIDPDSLWYPLALMACAILAAVIPFREARWLDVLSIVFLFGIQMSLVGLNRFFEWDGGAILVLVRFAVLATVLDAIRITVSRGLQLVSSPAQQMIEAQDQFWSVRVGYTAGAAIGLLLVLVMTVLILLGAPIIALIDDSVYQVVGAFGWLLVVLSVSSWFTSRSLMSRRESRGYRQSIKYLSAYPESGIRAVVSAEQELFRQQTRMGVAVSGLFLVGMVVARQTLGSDAENTVIVGGLGTLVLVLLALIRRMSMDFRRRWSEEVASRIEDRELYEQATRRSILQWPKGGEREQRHA